MSFVQEKKGCWNLIEQNPLVYVCNIHIELKFAIFDVFFSKQNELNSSRKPKSRIKLP